MLKKLTLAAILILSGCSYKNHKTEKTSPQTLAPENITEIKLAGDASNKHNEFSGLAWFKNSLVLLPQYIFNKNNIGYGKLYLIDRSEILKYIKGSIKEIKPAVLPVETKGFEKYGRRGSGCEAITFEADTCYMNVEIADWHKTYAILLKGIVKNGKLTFERKNFSTIPTQTNLPNISDETILLANNKIITIHEANGLNVNPHPAAHIFRENLKFIRTIPFPSIEFRITDATRIDAQNNFWVINYYFPGEFSLLKPAKDSIGAGAFNKTESLERLLELHYSKGKITRTLTPPIILHSWKKNLSRNWEGIARLTDLGFLIITDTYPRTILAFVPYPRKIIAKSN